MKHILLSFAFCVSFIQLTAQEYHTIEWQKPIDNETNTMLWYTNASSSFSSALTPEFCGEFAPNHPSMLQLADVVFAPLSAEEEKIMAFASVPTAIKFEQSLSFIAGQPLVKYCLLPVRLNTSTGKIEKVISFTIVESAQAAVTSSNKTSTTFDENSPLANGTWYRVAVSQTGVFKITPQFLAECGFSIANLASANVRVFGNGAGMLPEGNDQIDYAGLQEVAIWVEDGGDDLFNGNDYALFYAVGPHTWKYVLDTTKNPPINQFEHNNNVYDDKSYYFITVDNGPGKRIAQGDPQPTTTNYTTTKFDDLQFIEHDLINLVGSGRRWFGDLFDFKTSYDYTLQFADLAQNDTAWFMVRSVARSIASSSMNFRINNNLTAALNFSAVGTNPGNDHVVERSTRVPFIQNANTLNINVQYLKNGNASATAWLDFMSVHARRNLNLSGNSIVFRDRGAYLAGGAAQYQITGATNNPLVWDVTNHNHVRLVSTTNNNNTLVFNALSDSLRTFVALRGSNFPLPEKIGTITNQNLHGLTEVEMVIVAHPNFLSEANRLADFNRKEKNLGVVVVTPQEIYNEFSSGMQDVTAIKLFMRSLYEKSTGSKNLKYLLLFGDASYDYKNRMSNMHNFVPIYQSDASYSLNISFCTDDYFGYLDPNEGYKMLLESLDLGIGRLPVTNATQAKNAVDKIIEYQTDGTQHGDWRNRLLFSVDDVDASWERDFIIYMDRLANQLDTTVPNFNAQKIYIDAYNQIVLAGSQRYPEAQEDLFRKVENGALITSYLGHGGEVGWAKERLLQLSDINSWTNFKNMTLFITITCEFTRLDDPTRVSAGEQTFLNPRGGAIALISTTRPIYATTSTYNVNRIIMENLLYDNNGYYKTLGEAVQATKNSNSGGERVRFILVGDPSMHLAIPKHEVYTDSINGQHISVFADTINALSRVRISGYVGKANNGGLLSDFNGLLYPTVFDKKAKRQTLVNDGIGEPVQFETQENIIFRGKVSVTNGRFEYEFMVPLDISFAFGEGKISYYATDNITKDAAGANQDIIIGGLNLNAPPDIHGPIVRVFINDTNFISGGITDQNPIGLALISDSSGINTVGSGIGHDIIGILDGNTENPLILNNYFTSDLDSYTSGSVKYPFFNLASGEHTLMVRAWDVYNNFGQATIKFIVDDSPQIALNRLFNYPNPFSDFTTFQFEHNRAGEPLQVEIHIFNQMGEIVKTFNENLVSTGNLVNQIEWDGTSNQGNLLGAGVYVYRVRVTSQKDNSEALGYSRLVFIK